ncbi:uncharacterized protein [Haliotis asinina]|uniref:uncharacterized protein n=1 Tax=Haliotis asinina TaxID=109174 RepID=UPI0035326BFF
MARKQCSNMYLLLIVYLHLLTLQMTCCTVELTIHPDVITSDTTTPVTVQCSLNVLSSDIEKVYSVMIRRRDTAIAVAFTDHKTKMCDERLKASAVVNSSLTTPETYLQLTLQNVTCDDIGDYTCIMAVRKQHLSMEIMGPDKVYLKMSGNSCPFIDSLVYPRHGHHLEDTVSVTCFMLVRTRVSDWVWTNADDHTVATSEEGCTLATGGEMFNCSSVLHHRISISSSLICRLKNFSRRVRFDVKGDATDSRAMIFWEAGNEDTFKMGEFPDHTEVPGVSWLWAEAIIFLLCVLTVGGILLKYWKTIVQTGNANKPDHIRKAYNLHSNCRETEHKLMAENTIAGSSQTNEDIT